MAYIARLTHPFSFLLPAFAALALLVAPARAILVSGQYYPTSTTPTNDNTASGIPVENYVGYLYDTADSRYEASGVYLGNGWVITAQHVNQDYTAYTLDGVSYTINASSLRTVSGASVDLVMFQLTATPPLAALTIRASAPATNSAIVLVGYGDNGVPSATETSGTATVASQGGANTLLTANVAVGATTYTSTDFEATSVATSLVTGDSGGGGFVYNSATHGWELAGLLEAVDSTTSGGVTTYDNYLVNLSSYSASINSILTTSAAPEPETWALLGLGAGVTAWGASRSRRPGAAPASPLGRQG